MEKIEIFEKIREWAKQRELDKKGDIKTQFVKLLEEVGELSRAILNNDEKEISDAVGDIIIVLTNFVLISNIDDGIIEICIDKAYDEIKDRKGKIINNTFKKE